MAANDIVNRMIEDATRNDATGSRPAPSQMSQVSQESDDTGARVDPVDLFDRVKDFLRRHLDCEDRYLTAMTMWIAHTYVVGELDTTPRLAILSPEKRSGKTRVLECLSLMVPTPVNTVNVSPAYLFRKMAAGTLPTILLDETDALFASAHPSESTEQLRGILNAGYRQGATVGRATVIGKTVAVEDFPVFAPVCLAGIGDLPDTITDRSVIIHMKRRRASTQVETFRQRTARRETDPLRTMLAAWGRAASERIALMQDEDYPDLPNGIVDRDADVWEPLFIVADLIGGHWAPDLRETAIIMVQEKQKEPQSLGEKLLLDIRRVFDGDDMEGGQTVDAMFKNVLLSRLSKIEGSPWGTLGKNDEGIDSRYLTRTLAKYGIGENGKARSIRISGARDWGYQRSDFTDAWERYLPAPQSTESVTSVTSVTAPDDSNANDMTDGAELFASFDFDQLEAYASNDRKPPALRTCAQTLLARMKAYRMDDQRV